MSSGPILPGATLGVLGGGQLARMFALAARRLGYRIHVLSDIAASPASAVADLEVHADYHNLDAVAEFARRVEVVTLEFENVPAATAQAVLRRAPVRPGPHVLHTTQNRWREKTFLRGAGLPVPEFAAIRTSGELQEAVVRLGLPAVLKTAESGYDGKGQEILYDAMTADAAWTRLGRRESILERFVDFATELSVVAVRGADGTIAVYDPIATEHARHILDIATMPAGLPPSVAERAIDIARAVIETLDVVGVLCVEMFYTKSGELLVNELAPRPHNSAHLTIDAHATSQFEQQVRATCGLPLGSTAQHTPAAMTNLLGDLWGEGEPAWERLLRLADVHLHLYGKSEPRPQRKMGHVTALAATAVEARSAAIAARAALTGHR